MRAIRTWTDRTALRFFLHCRASVCVNKTRTTQLSCFGLSVFLSVITIIIIIIIINRHFTTCSSQKNWQKGARSDIVLCTVTLWKRTVFTRRMSEVVGWSVHWRRHFIPSRWARKTAGQAKCIGYDSGGMTSLFASGWKLATHFFVKSWDSSMHNTKNLHRFYPTIFESISAWLLCFTKWWWLLLVACPS